MIKGSFVWFGKHGGPCEARNMGFTVDFTDPFIGEVRTQGYRAQRDALSNYRSFLADFMWDRANDPTEGWTRIDEAIEQCRLDIWRIIQRNYWEFI